MVRKRPVLERRVTAPELGGGKEGIMSSVLIVVTVLIVVWFLQTRSGEYDNAAVPARVQLAILEDLLPGFERKGASPEDLAPIRSLHREAKAT